jgi:hypothetical protein
MWIICHKRKKERKDESMKRFYSMVRNQPVAKFFYQGNHSHPVRRTVLIVENNPDIITGYELREGNVVRDNLEKAPIKSYNKSLIAQVKQLDKRRVLRKETPKNRLNNTTLIRRSLDTLVLEGI